MELFGLFSAPELEKMIKELALQVASGAASVAYANGGSVVTVPRQQALLTLRQLNAEYAKKTGKPFNTGLSPRIVNVIPVSGYGNGAMRGARDYRR